MNIFQIIALIIAVSVAVYLLDARIRHIISATQNGVKDAAKELAANLRSKITRAEQRFSQEEKDLIMAIATTVEEGLAQLTALIGEVPPAITAATAAKDAQIATLTADNATLTAELAAAAGKISAAVSAGAATLGVVDPTV
jgi:hypothetical protein